MGCKDCKPLPELSEKDRRRFWSHVDKGPGHGPNGQCWIWLLSKNNGGYGQFRINNTYIKPHRVTYFLHYGVDPYPLNTLHNCDYPPCCNPEHIKPANQQQNMEDKIKKGRGARGILLGDYIILDEEKVKEIRRLHANGHISQRLMGKQFHVSQSSIWRVVRRKCWDWVV